MPVHDRSDLRFGHSLMIEDGSDALMRRSVRSARERMTAAFDRAPVETAAQPAHAIRRRAVRERFRNDLAARHPLQPVVADGGGRVQALPRRRPASSSRALPGRSVPTTPAKQSACSSSRTDSALRLSLAGARSRRAEPFGDAEQVLDVMADFVRDDVGLREIARAHRSVDRARGRSDRSR